MARGRGREERRPIRRSGGGGGMVVFLIILAVVGGAAVAFWDNIISMLDSKPNVATKSPKKKVSSKRKLTAKKAEVREVAKAQADAAPAPVRRAAPAPGLASDNARAQQMFGQADDAYRTLAFSQAGRIYQQVQAMQVSAQIKSKAKLAAEKMEAAQTLLSIVRVAHQAKAGSDVYRIVMTDDSVRVGAVENHKADPVRFMQGSIAFPIPQSQIRSIRKLSDADRESDQRKSYLGRLREVKADGAVRDFLRARLAFELQLGKEVAENFDGAFSRDPDLVATMHRYEAFKLLRRAIWRDSVGSDFIARSLCNQIIKDYDHVGKAKTDAQELLAMMDKRKQQKNYKRTFKIKEKKKAKTRPTPGRTKSEPEPAESTQETTVIAGSGSGAANVKFDEAVKYYRAGIHAQGGSRNSNLKKAVKLFDQSIAMYERIKPRTSGVESRLTDANMLRYGAMKSQTL
jgi:hypothetical protein